MLEIQQMLSVIQLHAQIKLTKMWKAANVTNYPLKIQTMQHNSDTRTTRSVTLENLKEHKMLNTFIGDSTRLWNKAPKGISCCYKTRYNVLGALRKRAQQFTLKDQDIS